MQSLNTKENANVGPILQDFKVNCLMTSPEAVLAAGSLVHRSREESLAYSKYRINIYHALNWGASLMAQMVKNLPTMKGTSVQSLGWEDPLEKKMVQFISV